jgi:hypothetical protein
VSSSNGISFKTVESDTCYVVRYSRTELQSTDLHASSNNAKTQSKQSGAGVVAMTFLFDAIFSIGFTPLQALYPVEVLSFEMKAKGMAFSNLAVSAGMLASKFFFLG